MSTAAAIKINTLKPELQAAQLAQELWPAGRLVLQRTTRWRLGETPRRHGGIGDNFWQWRQYQPGDPLRAIDWRRSARNEPAQAQAPWLREREHEESATLFLWADGSPSMRYHSQTQLPRKQIYAQTITHTLQQLGKRSGLRAMQVTGTNFTTAQLPKKPGAIVICSDFMAGTPQWQQPLNQLADQGWHGILVPILDPAERAWEFTGRLDIHEIGSAEHTVFDHAGILLADYQQRIDAHLLAIEQLARQLHWQYHLCISNNHMARDILHLVQQLNHVG